MADRPQTPEDVKALVEEHGIRFVRLWFTDILGQLKSFSLSNPGPEPFTALAMVPVGGRALLSGGEPFSPPWVL